MFRRGCKHQAFVLFFSFTSFAYIGLTTLATFSLKEAGVFSPRPGCIASLAAAANHAEGHGQKTTISLDFTRERRHIGIESRQTHCPPYSDGIIPVD